MNNYYDKIKNNHHIFIYGVCGRCTSTALQRILNSSNEICIFGESWNINCLLLNTIQKLEERNNELWKEEKERDFDLLRKCFFNNKHDKFYANAYRNLDETINSLKTTFSNLCKPINKVSRLFSGCDNMPHINCILLLLV